MDPRNTWQPSQLKLEGDMDNAGQDNNLQDVDLSLLQDYNNADQDNSLALLNNPTTPDFSWGLTDPLDDYSLQLFDPQRGFSELFTINDATQTDGPKTEPYL